MKRFVCLVVVSCFFVSVVAQTSLCLSTEKTTSLIFPFAIKHVDRGTSYLLAQQVKDVPNLLLVKAGLKDFAETNLTVATEDGSLYSFSVCYDGNPSLWVYRLPIQSKNSLEQYANAIMDNPKSVRGIKSKKWDMKAEINGIYVKHDVLYYQLFLQNNSPLDFDVELIRFYVGDKKKVKRTAVQEIDLKPLHIVGNTTTIKANSTSVGVFAFEKFTIPDAKYIGVQVMEKNGGRHLFLKITNRKLMQAISLPDIK